MEDKNIAIRRAHLLERAQEKETEMYTHGPRLYLSEDNEVVGADDERAAYLLAGENAAIPQSLADELDVDLLPVDDPADSAPALTSEEILAKIVSPSGVASGETGASADDNKGEIVMPDGSKPPKVK